MMMTEGQGHTVMKTVMGARLLLTHAATVMCYCCRLAWVCMSIRLPMFSSHIFIALPSESVSIMFLGCPVRSFVRLFFRSDIITTVSHE